jgi:phenylacetic acid degradation operon negative regulatory protein
MARIVEQLLDEFHGRTPIRAGSLIVSVFGDAIVPRGGRLSLASLLDIMRAFRINDGLVRTAMSRLVADGWLERWKVGRNSYYRLTAQGQSTFAEATDRIYGEPHRRWTGRFDLVLLEPGAERSNMRARLEQRGYGAVTPDVFIAPGPAAMEENGFIRLSAEPIDKANARAVAQRAWPVLDIEERYRRFVALFSSARDVVGRRGGLTDLDALVLRILLIHEYRRVILRDPLLPPDLLPSPWAGDEARKLCGQIYRTVAPAAERWLDEHAADDKGALPPAHKLERRFQDLA